MSKTIKLTSLSAIAALSIGLMGGCSSNGDTVEKLQADLQSCQSELSNLQSEINACRQKPRGKGF